jgi:hypothetical protein
MAAIAPVPAGLSCQKCGGRLFFAQASQAGAYLLLACVTCSEPRIFHILEEIRPQPVLEASSGGL